MIPSPSFQELLHTSSPLSQRELPKDPEEKEGYSAEPTPVSSRRPSFEGIHEAVGYTPAGQPILSMLAAEDASILALSSIRLSLRGTEQPHRGPLRSDLFEPPPSRIPSEKAVAWMLQAQDQIFLSPKKRNVEKLIEQYEKDSCQNPEFHRLYVQLHLANYEQAKYSFIHSLFAKRPLKVQKNLGEAQKKTEIVFLRFIEKFPRDVLIWKIFVTFLKTAIYNPEQDKIVYYYNPQEIVQLLDAPKLKGLRGLAWFQAIVKHFCEEKPMLGAKKIPITLKKCVELFQGNLDFTSQWTLEAEDALTRVNRKKVSHGETSESQLTPRKTKSLLDRLTRQFEQTVSLDSSLPFEVHRLYLRLRMKQMQAQGEKGLEPLFSRYKANCPGDFLAEYHIASFLVDCKATSTFRKRCVELIPRLPYLHWMEELLERVEKEK